MHVVVFGFFFILNENSQCDGAASPHREKKKLTPFSVVLICTFYLCVFVCGFSPPGHSK